MFADFVEITPESGAVAINRTQVLTVNIHEEMGYRARITLEEARAGTENPPTMRWFLTLRTVGDYNNGDSWPSYPFANRDLAQEAYNTICYGTKHGKGETA